MLKVTSGGKGKRYVLVEKASALAKEMKLNMQGSIPCLAINAISGHIHLKRYIRALLAHSLTTVNRGDDLSVSK